MMPVLSARGLVKRFGGLLASDDVDFALRPGEMHAVIGPNGAGKTTFLRLLSGEMRSDRGTIHLAGTDVTRLPIERRILLGMGRAFQITSLFDEFAAVENVALAVQARTGHSFRFWRPARRDPALRAPAMAALQRVGLAERAELPAQLLGHGERRQLEMAMVLCTDPIALLLDEPMAGMAQHDAQRMVALLQGLKGRTSTVLVEHDMDVVFALADRITVLVHGRVIACATPERIRADPSVRQSYLGEGAYVPRRRR